MITWRRYSVRERSLWSAPLLGFLAAGLTGCGDLLKVDNPNNLRGEDIELPVAGTAMANGVQALVAHGVNGASIIYHTVTDELEWSGSRDGFRELDQGKISNAYNEFTDGFYRDYAPGNIAEARWMADEAIRILEQQDANGTIRNRLDLARVYFYAAIAYVTIANVYDDWAFSDAPKREWGAPVGPQNMGTLYDKAITYLTKGMAIADAVGDLAHRRAIRAMRARANFDRAIWERVNPPRGGAGLVDPNSKYVTDAVADAQAALALMSGAPDYEYRFTFSVATGSPAQGAWIASRQENRLGRTYVAPHPTSPTWLNQVVIMDPIDNKPSPIVDRIQRRFRRDVGEGVYVGYTVVSAREMHLILAEAALARNDIVGFQTAINNLRALDGLTPWNPASSVSARDLLIHSRQTNLFMQTRRLSDHYRFNIPSREWLPGAQVLVNPGMFFPIPATECLSNPNIGRERCST
ncbi:MAG: hypothetical protein KatS3mg081_0769 [Gemmatimonadales bacterium]|nr:MAG: hypothetical protein KatS3mg081_0769 [Gemmatimonadales bacterium]